jgi:hypothetical protein
MHVKRMPFQTDSFHFCARESEPAEQLSPETLRRFCLSRDAAALQVDATLRFGGDRREDLIKTHGAEGT